MDLANFISDIVKLQTTQERMLDGQLTIHYLIQRLKDFKSDLTVVEDTKGWGLDLTWFHSYRGFYSDLAIIPDNENTCTVGELIQALEKSIGETYAGYKGGQFEMTPRTFVWLANYGQSNGRMVINVKLEGDYAVLITAEYEV